MDRTQLNFGVIGFSYRYRRTVSNRMDIGDRIVYYIKDIMAFGATATVIGDYFESDIQLWTNSNKLFPSRRYTEPNIVLEEKNFVNVKELISKLTFVKKRSIWGSYFQSSIHLLSFEDFHLIETEIKKNASVI
jgi:hypothetical protein